MTLADLRRAAELLAPGASVTLTREALLDVLADSNGSRVMADRTAPQPTADDSLTAGEVAALLKVSTRWVYDHGDELGAQHLSRRCVRYSRKAVTRRLARGA